MGLFNFKKTISKRSSENTTSKFKLEGNIFYIRTEEEMKHVDKAAADSAFKAQKKELDAFMKERGFVKYKTNSYVRKNPVDVLEYIDLQKERYGSKTFTVNFSLTPLYVPHSFFSWDFSERLGQLLADSDIWWDFADDKAAKISFQNIMKAIDEVLLPWFEGHSTDTAIKEELLKWKEIYESYGGRLSNIQQAWLELVDNHKNCNETVKKNIQDWKLPKNWM